METNRRMSSPAGNRPGVPSAAASQAARKPAPPKPGGKAKDTGGKNQKKEKKEKKPRRKLDWRIKLAIALLLIFPIFFSLLLPAPEGISQKSPYFGVDQLQFLYDLTYQKDDKAVHQLSIHQAELDMIAGAKEFILMDMFLFNSAYNKKESEFPASVKAIADALIAKKQQNPEMDVIFITDPINGFYGSYKETYQKKMKEAGITVVETNLNKLKDSNFLYSGYYRLLVHPLGTKGIKVIPNPFDKTENNVCVRSVLRLANVKANHRKVLLTDQGALVTSANPHDASAYHSNVGVRLSGPVIQELIEAERTVAAFSGKKLPELYYPLSGKTEIPGVRVRSLTEAEIGRALDARIKASKEGDTIRIGIFYLSDFRIVKELGEAAERGVLIQIVADPNKDAFGVKKNGSPNRTVLTNLQAKSENIEVRWYSTHGEQYHTKMAFFSGPERDVTILGSGNFTRKNIRGYNLECDLEIVTEKNHVFSAEVTKYFDRIWSNVDGEYTLDFEEYADTSTVKKVLYYIQEATGLCTY